MSCLRAIGPTRARLELEGRGAQTRDVVGQLFSLLARDRLDRAVAHGSTGKAGDMGEQILDGDLPLGRDCSEVRWCASAVRLDRRPPAPPPPRPPRRARRRSRSFAGRCRRCRRRHGNLLSLELRDVARHRIVESYLSFFNHHHDGDAGYRLRHGSNAEHGGRSDGLLAFQIHDAFCREVDDLALARHNRDCTSHLACRDPPFEHLIDAQQPL